MRRLLHRLLAALHRWAESGWAGPAVGSWAVLQGSVVPGPSEALLVPMGLADPPRVLPLAAWATAGATLGGVAAYAIGATALDSVAVPLVRLFGMSAADFEARRTLFEQRGWLVVLFSTVSPLPTKFVCMAAGAFGVPPVVFTAALGAGRAARFTAVSLLIRFAGERFVRRLERRKAERE
jgi:membrane protein YqaA with SNARE-associated domain